MGIPLALGVKSIAGQKAAKAAGQAAEAQSAAAQAQLVEARESRERAIRAAESPQELAALERQIQQQERGVQREEKFLSSIDPTLVEASQQALRLLRGEEASTLGPMRQQRERQRKMLLDQLRSQLGPGAETSSAGIQALTQFDQQTSLGLAQQQQASLGQLLGSAQQSGQLGRTSLSSLGQIGSNISGGFGNIASRRVNAITGSQAGISQAGQSVIQSSGSQFVRDQLRAQAEGQIGTDLFKLGATVLGASTGGMGGGAKGA